MQEAPRFGLWPLRGVYFFRANKKEPLCRRFWHAGRPLYCVLLGGLLRDDNPHIHKELFEHFIRCFKVAGSVCADPLAPAVPNFHLTGRPFDENMFHKAFCPACRFRVIMVPDRMAAGVRAARLRGNPGVKFAAAS
jgi:hypothetical protein